MNKKYSLSKMKTEKKIKRSKRETDKIYKRGKGAKLYLSAISTFLLAFIAIGISPYVFGKSYEYESVEINKAINVSGTMNLSVADMAMNRDTGLYKIVLRYDDTTGTKSLSNLKTEYKLNYITRKANSKASQKVVKLSDDTTILYFSNLPEDFGVISVTVEPRYVYPEIEPTDDLKDKEIKFYAVDTNIKSDKKLKVETISALQKDNFGYQTASIKQSIEKEQNEITKIELSNNIIKKDIKKAEENLDYQTTEEQVNTKNEISSKKTTMQNNEVRISELKNKIKQLEEKIDKLQKISSSFE